MDPLLNRIDRERSFGKAMAFGVAAVLCTTGAVFAFYAAYLLIRYGARGVKMTVVIAVTAIVALGGSFLAAKLFQLVRAEVRDIRARKPKPLSRIQTL